MMMHLLIASLHTDATGGSVRHWNAFAWLASVCLFGAGTCKSKSAVGAVKPATVTLASKLSSTTVAPSPKRTQGEQPVVTPGSGKKANTSARSTSQQASQSGGTATGSKQTHASGSTSEKPPIFSFKEQRIAIQTGEQKQLTLQASGNTSGYVVKSVSIKRAPSTTPYRDQFGLKHCIEQNQPCFFPESGFVLNVHPTSTLTAGIYTLTVRIGKQGVNSKPTNQLVTCEIVVCKEEAWNEEEFVENNTDHVINQEEIKQNPVEPKEATNAQNTQSEDDQGKNKDNTLICKVGGKIKIDYELENAEQYKILNVQMVKSGNKNSSPKKGFKIDNSEYKRGSIFKNTITFDANKEGSYTLLLTLQKKGAQDVKKISRPISIIA